MSRGALVTLLFVAAGLLLPFALVGLWTQQVLLDRERFTNLSDDLLDREAVRQGIADAVLTDVERTQPVPAATEPLIRSGINAALTTPAYRAAFKQSLGGVHDQLTSGDDTITLDVAPGLNLARSQNPQLAAALRGVQVQPIVIARRSEVPILWGAVDGAQRIALLTPLVVLAFLALAVAVSERRWRAVGIAGAVVAGVSLLFLGLMALAKQIVGGTLDQFAGRGAFDAAWDVIARSLTNTTLIIVIGALVVAAGGFVIDQLLVRRPAPESTRPSDAASGLSSSRRRPGGA
ncbi:MAG TPA: hypothetical protein VFA62_05005 [Acidimicrobiia bacterium]|nr:hypothetical protein [Acidimicrobiia bacterium]